MTIEIIEEVMPGTSIVEEIVNLQLSVIEGDTAAAEAAAAAAAASAASASSSASTATTQAGIATTKAQEADASATAAETARTGAETAETNAETAQAAAEAARDEIVGKFNFPSAVEGDLYQVDALGVGQPVSPVNLLQNKNPFLKSFVSAVNNGTSIIGFDSFNRTPGVVIGNLDSGQNWQVLFGTGWRIISTFSLNNNSNSPSVIYADFSSDLSSKGFRIKSYMSGRANETNSNAFWFGTDANNNFRLHIARDRIVLILTVLGVATTLATHIWSFPASITGIQSILQEIEVELYFRTAIFNQTFMIVKNRDLSQSFSINLTANVTAFPDIASISKIGFYSVGNNIDNISSFILSNKL